MLARYLTITFLLAVLSLSISAQPAHTPLWKVYYDSAQLFWGKNWPKTIPLLTRAEQSALNDLGIYDANYLTILNDLGLAYSQVKDYTTAEKLLSRSLTIKTELNDAPDADLFRSINNLAGVHAEQGHFLPARQLYKRVLSSTVSGAEPEIYWSAAKNLLLLYEANGKADSALLLLDAVKVNPAMETKDALVRNYEMKLARGRIDRKLRRYEEARAILEGIVSDLHDQQDRKFFSLYIQSLQESGLLYSETGQFNKAEKNLLQGFRLLKTEQPVNQVLLVELLNNLASVYDKLGIYDKAMVYYKESLDLCIRLHGQTSLATTTLQSNIAGIHLKQGELKEAIASYEMILKNLKSIVPESNLFYITVMNNLATAYRKDNQYNQAFSHLEQAYTLVQKYKLENDDLAATVMNNLAVLLTGHGEANQAIVYFEKAYAIKRAIYGEQSVLLMDLASNMAVVYWALRKPEKAMPLFQQSMTLAIKEIKYVFPNLSEHEQVQFYKKLKEDFERFNTVAFQASSQNPELLVQVFNNEITIKSLLFFTQRLRSNLIREKHDSVLNQQYELLKARREQLGYFYQLSLKELSSAETSATELEAEIDRLEKAISLKTSETVAEKMMEQGAQWSDLQNKLQPHEALIDVIRFRKYDLKTYVEGYADRVSFGFTDSVYYAALVTTRETTKNPQLILLKEGRNMEKRFLNYYRNALRFGVEDENSYPYYWKPFEKALAQKTTVYFSGDGVFHQINLNTLRPPGGAFVLQRYDLHYLLNPVQFLEKQKASFSTKTAVLYGDPLFDLTPSNEARTRNDDDRKFASLPGTHTEIVRIDEILKSKSWSTHVYLKRLATEGNLKNIHSPDILHIATHGFFSKDRITLSAEAKNDFLFHSGLVFSGANRNLGENTPDQDADDGILTAYEVMNLDLSNTSLVVLSACETGLGRIENGEGVYGLQRSFLQAGGRNILISLWKVEDQVTQELMVKFYYYLFQGKAKREALKLAQLDLLQKYRDPMLWGGFIMIGVD